ncbi:D-alanyl-D-alanine carboxypeptidase family protein [Lacrimispora sphenoides]|uniref:D-alanyl-D-alanine carboxypeptidase n=1 Tax=Lacrimispora sphenoides JCM 1415 TaxID=1297793 RepID=A0ABY1C6U5_9FIRM|nr:D-alanyl-D-alanine carboxypeptidase family protein [Lacrimispora sphenoides]SET74644.1 D-alanyl-D-alanine carboxypeptidase [[Clostridium] sphenoides JCM 1415]SUY50947.1 peptidase S11 D-alanyl-D-alanine carboxypeptidase 1 [Lacrimispora sphenoides]
MKKRVFVKSGCIALCTVFLTGCAGLKGLDNPYVYSERTALYQSSAVSGRAEPFAHDLCIVSEDPSSQDNAVTAEAAAVFDLTDKKVLFAKNPFERLYPASITKTMTALIALKYGNLTDEVTVTKDAVITEAGATLCGIKPGDKLTMEQLLYGLMLPSGNDAGSAIATHMAGGIDQFAQMMNDEALNVGATGTHFLNPHGLSDDDHYTTAYDLYLIFNEALKYPEFRKIVGTTEYTTTYQDGAGKPVNATWKGTNWYMTGERQMPEGLTVLGGKTGTTKAAGSCLIMGSSDSSKREYITVVLKAPNHAGLYDNMTNILNKIVE